MGHVTYSEYINATPEEIWAVVSDVTRMPDWAYNEGRFPYPVRGEYGTEQTEGVGTVWKGVSGDEQVATYEVTGWQPPNKLVYELRKSENAPLQMTQVNTLLIKPEDDGSRITWEVDWELTGGFSLSALLIRLTGNSTFEEMMAGSLESLKRLLENDKQEG